MTPQRFAAVARALSNPTRVAILRAVAARGSLNCTQVCARFPLSQPTISHHVRALARAGLITVRKSGPFHELRADRRALAAFAAGLGAGLGAGAESKRGRVGKAGGSKKGRGPGV